MSARILLVEDDAALRIMAAEVLCDAGHKVITAQSGAEALQIAANLREPLDLLLTDVVMPGMTGSEVPTVTDEVPRTVHDHDVGIVE